ncbi:MAG: hypothetical protein II936_04440 [Oscillospiraceae bacterium]|nr:hypothetical protein [Oscillospiraceae bacterium]
MNYEKFYKTVKKSVKSQLKSPVSAVFCDAEELNVKYIGPVSAFYDEDEDRVYTDCTAYEVNSYVSSQNSYGAMIQNDYYCKVLEKEDIDYYKVIECVVGEKTQTARTLSFIKWFIIVIILTGIGGYILYQISSFAVKK